MERFLGGLNALMAKCYIPCRIPADKQAHALSGLLLFLLAWGLAEINAALILVLIAAIGKELYDLGHPELHTCDVLDVVATVSIPCVIWGAVWML